MAHPEALRPTRDWPVWALVCMGANQRAHVVASSFAVTEDVDDSIGPSPDDLSMPITMGDGPGFYLWEGVMHFDGLDGVEYRDGASRKLDPVDAMVWMARHESEPPGRPAEQCAGSSEMPRG